MKKNIPIKNNNCKIFIVIELSEIIDTIEWTTYFGSAKILYVEFKNLVLILLNEK